MTFKEMRSKYKPKVSEAELKTGRTVFNYLTFRQDQR
jgi:hypothetical protein